MYEPLGNDGWWTICDDVFIVHVLCRGHGGRSPLIGGRLERVSQIKSFFVFQI